AHVRMSGASRAPGHAQCFLVACFGDCQAADPTCADAEAARFVFTTEASLASASVAALRRKTHKKVSAINSGFGFPDAAPRIARGRGPGIGQLGTVDFGQQTPGL